MTKAKVKIVYDSYRQYFPDDKESRNVYRVYISNHNKRISFLFGDSINNAQQGKEPEENDILACVRSDYYYTQQNYPTLESFCNEFGYDIDSRKAEKIYKACLKQAEKLHKVFTDEEIEKLPE